MPVPTKSKKSSTQKEAHKILREAVAKWETSDAVFVSINTKWANTSPGEPPRLLEVGLAYVDTYYLRKIPPSTWSFKVRHLIINTNKGYNNPYYENKSGYFRFGRSYHCQLNRARTVISELFSHFGRRIHLVTFHGKQDIMRFQELGIDISRLQNYDLMQLDRTAFGRIYPRNLRDICGEVKDGDFDVMRYWTPEKTGNAGNDAFFQLCLFTYMCFNI